MLLPECSLSRIYLGIDFQILVPYLAFLVRQWKHALVSPRGSVDEFRTCCLRLPYFPRVGVLGPEFDSCPSLLYGEVYAVNSSSVHVGTAPSGSIVFFFAPTCACWITHNSLSDSVDGFCSRKGLAPSIWQLLVRCFSRCSPEKSLLPDFARR